MKLMFYDRAKIYVKGGDGGSGCVAFRREKYVPEGGPSGGDGGRGGSIIFVGDSGLNTLVDFRYHSHYKGNRGEHGQGKDMTGRSGEDRTLRVPVGTVIYNADTMELVADVVEHGQKVVVARGGRGGRGNARFATPNNKVPTAYEKGEPGQERWLRLELKLLADVGLAGFPNAGKSTVISRVSAAKPKIADYPFTTLVPNLGVVRVREGESFVMADIPGLIEGAHTGLGLGHEFLRHLERTRLIIHVLDMSGSEGRDPLEDFRIINRELRLYNEKLARRPQLVAANKMDLPDAAKNLDAFKDAFSGSYEIFPISAVTGEGLDRLVYRVAEMLPAIPREVLHQAEEEKTFRFENRDRFEIIREDGMFVVTGQEIERHVAMTDMENEDAVTRLQQIMSLMGLDKALRQAGAKEGDEVKIGNLVFDFSD
ncbi:GTP-binding protein Obg/CgtA [Desulfofarcimen acetoxidans DSM 771]|uniref:GTPase Obg n=2 Tax=Desulfofarcimen acetoxidans TaxID=58138 RepID=C8W5P3_DESAS|nr:GTP-binding protein Obg/CgtA [Desulfofarcimen acetoxidans DSM 771]